MCLAIFSFDPTLPIPFSLMHNRDEFFDRPSSSFKSWDNPPGVYGGQDLKAGGMWLGFSDQKRFAMLTNYRDLKNREADKASRGKLVLDFLSSTSTPLTFLSELKKRTGEFNGFNIVVGVLPDRFAFLNSIDGRVQPLFPGTYGLSNARLDTPWFKVRRGKALFDSIIQSKSDGGVIRDKFMNALRDEQTAAVEELPDTGLSPDQERLLSPIFIRSGNITFGGKGYGTVSSVACTVDAKGATVLIEQAHGAKGSGFPTEYRF